MRLIRLTDKAVGKKISQKILSEKGMVLITSGTILTKNKIKHLKQNGYESAYVETELNNHNLEFKLEDIIDPLERKRNVNTIKTLANIITDFSEKNDNHRDYKSVINFSAEVDTNLRKMISSLTNNLNSNQKITMVDIKSENYFFEHQVNVALLSLYIGKLLNMKLNELKKLAKAALLYDIGNFFIDKELLKKPNKHTNIERKKIEKHTEMAYDFLKKNTNLSVIEILPTLQHHERINGSGYPNGLKENQIHLYSKIIAIADVYDALTSDRPHRKAEAQNEAIEHLMGGAGVLYDYDLISLFVKNIIPYPKGTKVLLSNNSIAVVVSQEKHLPLRPRVFVTQKIMDKNPGGYISLVDNHNLTIKCAILE